MDVAHHKLIKAAQCAFILKLICTESFLRIRQFAVEESLASQNLKLDSGNIAQCEVQIGMKQK